MRILFLGAGAIGGYYGFHLARAGADVTFLVRPARAERLRQGLVLHSRGETLSAAVKTVQAGGIDRPFDLVVLTCKAFDLDDAIAVIAPAMGPDSLVLPLLNGIAHLDRLDAAFGAARVLGGAAYIATTLTPDGAIRHTSPGDSIIFGDRSGRRAAPVEALATAFAATPVTARASDVILQEMWEKWCMIAAGAALTCLMRGPVCDIMATEFGGDLAATFLGETAAIAAAQGHAPRPPAAEQARRTLTDPASRWAASMMRDIEKRLHVEADHIVGDLIHRGAAAGVTAPLLRAAYSHLQVYNAQRMGAAA